MATTATKVRRKVKGRGAVKWHDDPTPEEIEQRAAEVRAGWSQEDWQRRFGARFGDCLLRAKDPRLDG